MAAMEHDTPTSTAAPASIIQPVRSGAVHGWFLRPDDRLHVGRRDCSALADKMGWQVTAVEKALLAAGLDPLPPIIPVLCFIDGDWPLIGGSFTIDGLQVLWPRKAQEHIKRPGPLTNDQVQALRSRLADTFPMA